jgi:hypothetical protein
MNCLLHICHLLLASELEIELDLPQTQSNY